MSAAVGVAVPSPDLRSPRVLRPVVGLTVTITAVSTVWTPPLWVSLLVAGMVVAVLGIPHGAVDHLVVEAIDGRRPGSRRRFVVRYLVAMGGVALVWLVAPAAALVAFLVMSVHHFGQSDLAHLRLSGWPQLAMQWSRGLLLVGLPIVAHLETVAPVIDDLGGADPSAWPWLADRSAWWCAVLVVQHVVLGALLSRRSPPTAVRHELSTVAVLTPLFLLADPLIGFAVYFGLWHSLGHLLVLADLLGAEPRPVRSLARLAAPLSAVSLGGFAAVVGVVAVGGRLDALLPLAVVFVAMLTAPHMVVVERLWRAEP